MDLDQCEFGPHAVDIAVIKELAGHFKSNCLDPLTVAPAVAHRQLGVVTSNGAQDALTPCSGSHPVPEPPHYHYLF